MPRSGATRSRPWEILHTADLGGWPNTQVGVGLGHLTTAGGGGLSCAQSQTPRRAWYLESGRPARGRDAVRGGGGPGDRVENIPSRPAAHPSVGSGGMVPKTPGSDRLARTRSVRSGCCTVVPDSFARRTPGSALRTAGARLDGVSPPPVPRPDGRSRDKTSPSGARPLAVRGTLGSQRSGAVELVRGE